MAGVLGRESLALKNMAQMAAAIRAEDFHPPSVGIGHTAHRAGHGVVKAGPAAAGFELVLGMVKRHAALTADIGACRVIVEIAARVRGLRGFAQ